MSDLPRAPVYIPVFKRRAPAPDWFPNLLLSTLALVSSAPPTTPAPFDQPVRRNHMSGQTEGFPNLLTFPASATPKPFVSNVHWPQPGRRDSIGGQFLATSVYLPTPLPITPADLGAPLRRARFQDPGLFVNVTARLPASVFVPPFLPPQWPQLARKDSTAGQYSASVFYQPSATVLPNTAPPVVWPQLGRRNSLSGQFGSSVIYLPIPLPVLPFTPAFLPEQPRRIKNAQTDIPPNVLIRDLAPVPPPIVFPRDLSELAKKGRSGQQTEYLLNVTVRLPPSVFVPPFLPYDWPYPIRRGSSRVAQVPFDTPNLVLINAIGPPPPVPMRVCAVSCGTHAGRYYEPGDVFDILSNEYSDSTVNYQAGGGIWAPGWMLAVPSSTPLYQRIVSEPHPTFPVVDPNRRFVM